MRLNSIRYCSRRSALRDERTGTVRRAMSALLLGIVAAVLSGCHSTPKLPEKGSKAYADTVSAFYVGLAALR